MRVEDKIARLAINNDAKRLAVSSNDADVLHKLAETNNACVVLTRIARNKNTDIKTLEFISKNKSLSVFIALCKNENTTTLLLNNMFDVIKNNKLLVNQVPWRQRWRGLKDKGPSRDSRSSILNINNLMQLKKLYQEMLFHKNTSLEIILSACNSQYTHISDLAKQARVHRLSLLS